MRIDKLCNLANKWFCYMGGAAIVLMTGLACANILLRPFGHPWKGTYEIVGFLGGLVFAFALGNAQITDSHISIDIMYTHYSNRAKKLVKAFGLSLSILFFGLLSWRLFHYATFIIKTGEKSDTLGISFYPFIYAIAFGFLFFVLVLFTNLLNLLISEKRSSK